MYVINNEKENIVPYLQSKYGVAFTLETYELRSLDIPYDEAVCTDASGRKLKVYVDYTEGRAEMTDNYYGVLKMPEYEEKLQSILRELGLEARVSTRFRANYFQKHFVEETPLFEAMAQYPDRFFTNTFLFVSEAVQLEESLFRQLCQRLWSENMTMYLAVYSVPDPAVALSMADATLRFQQIVK